MGDLDELQRRSSKLKPCIYIPLIVRGILAIHIDCIYYTLYEVYKGILRLLIKNLGASKMGETY